MKRVDVLPLLVSPSEIASRQTARNYVVLGLLGAVSLRPETAGSISTLCWRLQPLERWL